MKYNILLATALLASAFSACKDDMEYGEYVLNTREYVDETFGGVTNMSNNVYNYLDVDYGNYSGAMQCCATDEAVCAALSNTVQGFTNGNWSASNNLDAKRWEDAYKGIQCANYYLKNFQGMTFDDLKNNGSYEKDMIRYYYSFPEVRALRAYLYFDLVRNYGDVPYFTDVVSVDNANSMPRTPALTILDNIIAECDAIKDTVVYDFSDNPYEIGSYDGMNYRVDHFFVLALKARAALYAASPLFNPAPSTERWTAAAKAAKQLIDESNARKGKHGLTNDYSIITSAFPLETGEVIFARMPYPIKNNKREGWNYPVGIEGGGSGLNCPSQTLVDAYEMKATGKSINEEGSGYDPANPYKGRDPRLAMTIACNGDVWPAVYKDTVSNAFRLETWAYDASGNIGISGPNVSGGTPTSYLLKKGVQGGTEDSYKNGVTFRTGAIGVTEAMHCWVTFRLAEFYLNFAEAAFRATGNATTPVEGMTANEAVNIVRKRVGMPAFPEELAGDDWMRKYKNERFVELAFEGHRFYDLRRWKGDSDGVDAEHRMQSVDGMTIIKNADGSFSYERKTISRKWDNKMYLFPIAQSELLKNSALVQNAGW
ncbi:MAG: RagB/SusD family nutrient uptake outer membrane protein [Bacteroidales bacterium]|nr:RagB/SusD family nutrient uptake outer membrane protein [Bacteroidales bacterium]